MQCQICTEKRKPLSCVFCSKSACRSCWYIYLLDTQDDANCMFCRSRFDRSTMISMFSRAFLNTKYRQHREAVLLHQETAMLADTQPLVDQEIQRREKQRIIADLYRQKIALRQELRTLEDTIRDVYRQQIAPLERRTFTQKCGDDSCRGYVTTAWRCNVCEQYTCPDCLVVKPGRSAQHECDPRTKETLCLIRGDSRKCPGCHIFIVRQEGCDQMWCTFCQTAFSWRSGEKINGRIHNPHWYEAQRQGIHGLARDHADIPCGGRPHITELTRHAGTLSIYSELLKIHRLITHVEEHDLPYYPTNVNEQENVALRIKYVLKDIDETKFKRLLQQKEKNINFKRDVGNILQMVTDASSDLMRQMIINRKFSTDILKKLLQYANESLKQVSDVYNLLTPRFNMTSLTVYRVK